MNNLILNGNEAWFCPPRNKYGLNTNEIKYVTFDDFSFVTSIQVDWVGLDTNLPRKEGGVIIKNGKHLGISVIKFDTNNSDMNDYFIKGTVWSKHENGNELPTDILLPILYSEKNIDTRLDISLSYDKNSNKLTLYCNGRFEEKIIKGKLLDYSTSWLWVGVSNALESCPIDLRYYFYGIINYVGIYQTCLTNDDLVSIFSNYKKINYSFNPICVFDFEKQTQFKVLDISKSGNNITKFDSAWMDSI